MKVSVFGIENFPFGKKALADDRLDKMKELFRSQKITKIQVDFTGEADLKTADAILCPQDKKLDLMILDIEIVENKLARTQSEDEKKLLAKCQELLEKETPLSCGGFSQEDLKWLSNNNFVTTKPVVFVSKDEIEDVSSLVKKIYSQAGMIVFLTGGPKESRAWEIRKDSSAVAAAECIHSDIARGFIKADVMAYDELVKIGNVNQAKNQGLLRQEGKDYVVKDGDIIEFKFSV